VDQCRRRRRPPYSGERAINKPVRFGGQSILARSARGSFRDALDQPDCGALSALVLYTAERLHEAKRVCSFQQPKHLAAADGLTIVVREKEGEGNFKDFCDLLQSTCANSIGASFVFLHLLKTNAERFTNLSL
jgi:hypothetical protein